MEYSSSMEMDEFFLCAVYLIVVFIICMQLHIWFMRGMPKNKWIILNITAIDRWTKIWRV